MYLIRYLYLKVHIQIVPIDILLFRMHILLHLNNKAVGKISIVLISLKKFVIITMPQWFTLHARYISNRIEVVKHRQWRSKGGMFVPGDSLRVVP